VKKAICTGFDVDANLFQLASDMYRLTLIHIFAPYFEKLTSRLKEVVKLLLEIEA
jgi:hypothetical protein